MYYQKKYFMETKELGHRIMLLRKHKGLNQEEVAKLIGVSRPVFTQIENGKRPPSFFEMEKICNFLGTTMDKIITKDFSIEKIESSPVESTNHEERISVSELNIEKFKNILLYILNECGSKANFGETVLYKLLYFADFNYYEIHEEQMTGATYRKLPYGPVPQKLDSIIADMIEKDQINRIKTEYHGFTQTKYIPKERPNLKLINGAEKEVLDHVIDRLSDYSAKAISEYSHKDMPWMATEEGEVIDYELAFYREAPYSARNYNEEE